MQGSFQMADKPAVMRQLLPRLLYNYDLVVSQTFTTSAGELWGFYSSLSDSRNASSRFYTRWEQYGGSYTQYSMDADGNNLAITDSATNADNSQGAWVTIVNRTDPTNIAWVPVYVWNNVAWITNSRPIYNQQGTYIGVCSTDLELEFINRLLSERAKMVSRPTIINSRPLPISPTRCSRLCTRTCKPGSFRWRR
ncbi:hypothetical protein BC828DRAFT_299466 [Blastocladiella britannica]|nr:hypothetical protein BC828DRAFT_299466 [Blastocladiella britannica]